MTNQSSIEKKLIIKTIIVDIIIFALLSPFFFITFKNGERYIGVPLGFLLGCIISILCQLLIIAQANIICSKNGANLGAMPIVSFCYMGRLLLYGGGFFLALALEYMGNMKLFSWYTVLAGYMIIKIIIFITYAQVKSNNLTSQK